MSSVEPPSGLPVAGTPSWAVVWTRVLRTHSLVILAAVAVVNLALTLFTLFETLQDYPNSADEYAYLVSAEIFARGRLSVPSPHLPRFFDVMHVVNNGTFYGKYPPGWSAILSVGVLLGEPWLINPLLGLGALGAIYLLARRHFSVEAASLSALALLGSPFLVFNSASYFSHPACLLFVVLAFHFVLTCVATPGDRWAHLGMGLCVGVAFVIRPFTVVVLMAVPAVYLFLQLRHREARKPRILGLLLAAAPFAVCLGLFLEYNRIQTGNPFLQPFEMYASWDVPTLPKDRADWMGRVDTHVLTRTWDLNRWLAFSPVFLALACVLKPLRKDPRVLVFVLSFLTLSGAFFFYWGEGGFQYGPRYLFEALGGLTVVTALGIAHFGSKGALMLASILLLNGATFVKETDVAAEQVEAKKDVDYRALEIGRSNLIVFVRTNSGPAPVWDLPRNGIDFNTPILYVRDLGPENRLLLEEHPDRKAYYYEYDSELGRGRMTPYTPERSTR